MSAISSAQHTTSNDDEEEEEKRKVSNPRIMITMENHALIEAKQRPSMQSTLLVEMSGISMNAMEFFNFDGNKKTTMTVRMRSNFSTSRECTPRHSNVYAPIY